MGKTEQLSGDRVPARDLQGQVLRGTSTLALGTMCRREAGVARTAEGGRRGEGEVSGWRSLGGSLRVKAVTHLCLLLGEMGRGRMF